MTDEIKENTKEVEKRLKEAIESRDAHLNKAREQLNGIKESEPNVYNILNSALASGKSLTPKEIELLIKRAQAAANAD